MEVVFLHGFASDANVWQGYNIKNVKNNFYNIRFDKNNQPILPNITEDTVLVGWSMGGMIAVEILKKYKEKIKAVFLLSSAPSFMKSDIFSKGKTKEELDLFKNMFFASNKGVAKFQQQLFSKKEIKDGWLKKFRKEIAGKIILDKKTLISSINFLEHYKLDAVFNDFNNIFVFHGNNDVVVNVSATNSWKCVFPKAFVFILNASHSLPFVKRDIVVFEIQKFCDEYR